MNVFTFTGNLGKDCEKKTTQGGTNICEFSVGVTSGFGDKAKTTWVKCSLFGKKAEGKLPDYLVKGQKVCVSGEVTLEEWANKEGVKNSMLKVNVNSLDLIGDKKESKPAKEYEPKTMSKDAFDDLSFDDSVPF